MKEFQRDNSPGKVAQGQWDGGGRVVKFDGSGVRTC